MESDLHQTVLAILGVLVVAVASAPAAAELTVTVSRAVPIVGEQVTLGARCTGEALPDGLSIDLSLSVGSEHTDLGSHEAAPQEDGSLQGTMPWTPRIDGFHRVLAAARIGGEMVEVERTIPVVRRPLHFVWYGSGPELRWATAITPPPKEPELQRMWRDRGVLQLAWKGAKLAADRDMAQYWLQFGDADGIAIDEIGAYDRLPAAEERAGRALDALGGFKEGAPEGFLAVWNAGSLTAMAANAYRQHADLVMLEAYRQYVRGAFNTRSFYDYIDQRVVMARRMDVLDRCVVGLGITDAYGGVTEAEVRRSVEHVRLVAPEMPGIAWFRYAGPERVDPAVLRAADEAAVEYFLRPCLMVREWDLQFVPGRPGRLCANVHNIGGMDARDVAVAFYRGHPDSGGSLIGRVDMPVLHAPRGWREEYEKLPPAEAKSLAFGVREASVPWSPQGRASEVWTRIWAPEATLLSDLAHRRMWTPNEVEMSR